MPPMTDSEMLDLMAELLVASCVGPDLDDARHRLMAAVLERRDRRENLCPACRGEGSHPFVNKAGVACTALCVACDGTGRKQKDAKDGEEAGT